MRVHYAQHATSIRYRTNIQTTQTEHMKHWIFVNSTGRRIRSIGKEAFFRTRAFAMSPAFVDQLRRGTCAAMSPKDQALALHWISDVWFLGEEASSHSYFMKLPIHVRSFPALRRCLLLYRYSSSDPEDTILAAKPNVIERGYLLLDDDGRPILERTATSFEFAEAMKGKLVRTGFPSHVQFGLSIPDHVSRRALWREYYYDVLAALVCKEVYMNV